MGTLPVFSATYCATRSTCVLVDAWLQLALCVLSVAALALLLVATRCFRGCRAHREEDEDARERSVLRRILLGRPRSGRAHVRHLLRRGKATAPLPMAVIKKDATTANILSHKNSQQHGAAFILQTQRMTHMDMAIQRYQQPPPQPTPQPPAQPQHRAPRAEPAVVSVVKPLAQIVPGRVDTVTDFAALRGRRQPPMLTNTPEEQSPSSGSFGFSISFNARRPSRERSEPTPEPRRWSRNSSNGTTQSSSTASATNAVTLDPVQPMRKATLGPDTSFVIEATPPSTPSGLAKLTTALLTPFSPRGRQQASKKTQEESAALFDPMSYVHKAEMAELSPDDRVQNERRSSMQLRHKRRLSIGVNSRLQFQVGGDQASVYEVKLKEIHLVKRLAFGPLSEVYAALWRDTKVGVKLLMPREGVVDNLQEAVRNFRREIWVMSSLKHPNVLKLIGASLTPSCYVLVMEYMANGSLYDYLRDADNFFPHQMVLTAALDVAVGMAHIHASGVLQRDLKSKNCLLSDNLVVKVADFGLARFQSTAYGALTFVGTPFWAAPEVIRHEDYDEKADVYSFAIVLWELVERRDPYGRLNAFQVPLQVANDGLRPDEFSRPAPLGLEQLMKQCWHADPDMRPPFGEIADTLHKWLYPPAEDSAGADLEQPAELALAIRGREDTDADLSTHVLREQHAANEEELHRFAQSHDQSERSIPITLSPVRRTSSQIWLRKASKAGGDTGGSNRPPAYDRHSIAIGQVKGSLLQHGACPAPDTLTPDALAPA